jgi:hypothetical protein
MTHSNGQESTGELNTIGINFSGKEDEAFIKGGRKNAFISQGQTRDKCLFADDRKV